MANRSEKVIVWLEPELKRVCERIAQEEGRSLSNLFRMAAERIAADNPTVPASDRARKIAENTRRLIAERVR